MKKALFLILLLALFVLLMSSCVPSPEDQQAFDASWTDVQDKYGQDTGWQQVSDKDLWYATDVKHNVICYKMKRYAAGSMPISCVKL